MRQIARRAALVWAVGRMVAYLLEQALTALGTTTT